MLLIYLQITTHPQQFIFYEQQLEQHFKIAKIWFSLFHDDLYHLAEFMTNKIAPAPVSIGIGEIDN